MSQTVRVHESVVPYLDPIGVLAATMMLALGSIPATAQVGRGNGAGAGACLLAARADEYFLAWHG